jgi:hypothetical protein
MEPITKIKITKKIIIVFMLKESDLSPSPYVSSYRTRLNSQANFLAAPTPTPQISGVTHDRRDSDSQ